MPETVNSRTLRFVKGNQIVMADDVLIGMTPLSGSELMEAAKFEYVNLHEAEQLAVSEVWTIHQNTRLAMFDVDNGWSGVLVWRSDLGADPDLFDWERIRIYRV